MQKKNYDFREFLGFFVQNLPKKSHNATIQNVKKTLCIFWCEVSQTPPMVLQMFSSIWSSKVLQSPEGSKVFMPFVCLREFKANDAKLIHCSHTHTCTTRSSSKQGCEKKPCPPRPPKKLSDFISAMGEN